ncbi:hypothetical protein V1521DRAFT_424055 [Lipomyces starkeyi]
MQSSLVVADATQSLQQPVPQRIITVSELLYTCLRLRATSDEFSRFLKDLTTTSLVESQLVYDNLINAPYTVCPDPLHIQYILSAVSCSPPIVSLPPLLTTLQTARLDLRLDVLQALTPVVKTWTPSSRKELGELVLILTSYLDETTTTSSNLFMDVIEPVPVVNEGLRDVVAGFITALAENANVEKMFTYGVGKEQWTVFESSLGSFVADLRVTNKPLGENLAQKTKTFMSGGHTSTSLSTPAMSEPKAPQRKLTWMESMVRMPEIGISKPINIFDIA